jgi:hypothetical protein
VLTIESLKCRVCGSKHAADATTCPICGAKVRSSSATGKSSGKAKPEPFGLDPATLLAKIDALDWEDPTIQPQSAAAPPLPAQAKNSLLLPFIVGFVVLLAGAMALRYYSGGRPAAVVPSISGTVQPVAPPPVPTPEPVQVAATVPDQPVPAVADGSAAPVTSADEAAKASQEAARRQRIELRRKALAAKLAMEEQSRVDHAEHERLRAEREAAEARTKVVAPVAPTVPPKAPTSPQELCAGEPSVFGRNGCEGRACSEAKWRTHPFCVQRWQDELRKLSPGSGGG